MANNNQINLSEQLQLLHELNYSDLHMPYGTHSNKATREYGTNREVRFLDAIAAALTTGNPGDVFAAAFDKRGHVEVVLAKNGPLTPEDIAAANELMSLIGDPTVVSAMELFPFLIQRCEANINKRIQNLHTSIQGRELRSDFTSALQAYLPKTDIRVEFPGRGGGVFLGRYGDGAPSFTTVWRDLVEAITDMTSHGLDAETSQKYAILYLRADALGRSRFLNTLIANCGPLEMDRKGRLEKLERRLGKVCQYVSGISELIQGAKKMLPIRHRWVTDTFTGSGEGVFHLCDSPHDAVARGLGTALSEDIVNKLHQDFPFILSNWRRRQTVHACVHAELRILLHFGLPPPRSFPVQHPIGVSKRSCICCALWIEVHNSIFKTRWLTSGSHGKPYANWALPGTACGYAVGDDGRSSVDDAVLTAVSIQLTDALAWLLSGPRRISDEHGSSDESSDGDQQSEWLLHVLDSASRFDW